MDEVISQDSVIQDAYSDIYEDYAESASFLWLLRSIAVTEPNYNTDEIAELEQRIEAQLNGLMTSIELAWQVCGNALDSEQAGEVFTATVIACRSRDMDKIKIAITAGFLNDDTFKGAVSALGWLPDNLAHSWINKFLSSKDLDHKYLALSACSVRRKDPGEMLNKILQRDDCLAHDKLHARALRLIGELRRQDLMPALETAMVSENKDIVFWANWSAILLGNKFVVEKLKAYFSDDFYQDIAIQLAFRVVSVEQGRIWISEMVKKKDHIRTVIKSVGILGDPHAVNWLITLMNEPLYTRLAGESFTSITGIDLAEHKLSFEPSEHADELPNDNPVDDVVYIDEDDNLPWPDSDKVRGIWQQYGQNFIVGQRYFMGRKITPELLKKKIVSGTQRQRRAAALELALIDTKQRLLNVYHRVTGVS